MPGGRLINISVFILVAKNVSLNSLLKAKFKNVLELNTSTSKLPRCVILSTNVSRAVIILPFFPESIPDLFPILFISLHVVYIASLLLASFKI